MATNKSERLSSFELAEGQRGETAGSAEESTSAEQTRQHQRTKAFATLTIDLGRAGNLNGSLTLQNTEKQCECI